MQVSGLTEMRSDMKHTVLTTRPIPSRKPEAAREPKARGLAGKEISALADRMVAATDPAEAGWLREEIVRGFYGGPPPMLKIRRGRELS